jgi:hypothetical protein
MQHQIPRERDLPVRDLQAVHFDPDDAARNMIATPFIKPRTLSRFLWTYLIPLVPLATCWDGVISMLRVYSERELRELADSLKVEKYVWEIGRASTGTPLFDFTYLVGYPV